MKKNIKWLIGTDTGKIKLNKDIRLIYDNSELESEDDKSDNEDSQREAPQKENLIIKYYFNKINLRVTPLNLGIYHDIKLDGLERKYSLRTTKYIGIMPLLPLEKSMDHLKSSNLSDIWLAVTPRFNLKPHDMLKEILAGNDFYNTPEMLTFEYFTRDKLWEKDWKEEVKEEKKILFGRIKGVGKVDLSKVDSEKSKEMVCSLAEEYGAFEIIDFIMKVKEVCKKNLKKQSQRVEENLNCKVKGRILVQKQIKYNDLRGQYQKVYCAYNKMSENIRENEILKYALYLCERNSNGITDSMNEDVLFCKRALADIPLKKCNGRSFLGLKNNGAYHYYKDALDAAKRIIERYAIQYVDNQKKEATIRSYQVEPFFIDMNYLFELYCRAVMQKAIEKYNNEIKKEQEEGLFELESKNCARRKLFMDDIVNNYFMKEYIPDIVLMYRGKVAAVFDAKYSDIAKNYTYKRDRTHQLLFYMDTLQSNFGGLIGMKDSDQENKSDKLLLPIQFNLHSEKVPSNDSETTGKQYITGIQFSADNAKESFKEHIEQIEEILKEIKKKIQSQEKKEELYKCIVEKCENICNNKEDKMSKKKLEDLWKDIKILLKNIEELN